MPSSRSIRLVLAIVVALQAGAGSVDALDPARRFPDYAQQVWTMKDGLPQDSVTALVQARDGYLWFGTFDGLVRFDGAQFTTFNLIRQAGMGTNVVLSLVEAPDGALWIGTRDGIARYANGRFTVHGRAQGVTDALIRCLAFDRRGTLWAGTRAGGLNRLDAGTWSALTTSDGLLANDVRAVWTGRDGSLWVGTARGLNRVREGVLEEIPFPADPGGTTVLSLLEDPRGVLWVGTTSGLWSVPAGGRQVAGPVRLAGRQIRALAADGDDNIWVGTADGIARIHGDRILESDPTGPDRKDVRSMLIDREASLWLGTDGTGLRRWRDASVVMVRTNVGPDSNTLMSLVQDREGAIWMAANCGGVVRWQDGAARAFTAADGLPDNCARSVAVAPDGAVWVGTVGGLARIDRGRVTRRLTMAQGLAGNRVMSLMVDRGGVVWSGTSDAGLDRIDGSQFTHFGVSTGLTSNDVRVIVESRDGGIWVGTYGGGLWRIRNGQVTTLTRQDGLSSNSILALLEDADGTLWIGTVGGGLNRLAQGRVTVYTTAEGLFSDGVFQVLDDGRGSLWMGSNRGVFRVSRQELDEFARGVRRRITSLALGAPDGLESGGVMGGAQPAGWVARDGTLWFPTIAGAAVIDPARLVRNLVPPPVLVRQFVVDRAAWPGTNPVRLPAGSREVEFQYTAMSFAAPDRVLFKYRLVGFSPEWVDAGTRRTAYFTNLAPGTYRFEVTACNNDGVWNEKGASLSFVVLPHLYETRWFQVLAALGALALAAGASSLRVRRVRRHERELARQVDEALAQVKVLNGLLPTCASCKRIRDEGGEWRQMEAYIRQHSQAEFSHGICPECMARLYPGFDPNRRE